MRLGKTRNWAAAGRRLFGQPTERHEGSLATEERNALLGADSGVSPGEFTSPEEEPMLAGDPTQHLLTALGRFHRQVVKAKSAASQEEWCEECMNQIIAGIEIALTQDWEDVQEALTDAARVLLSYEEAGRAQDCVSFLQDGYEILCLMVGDLIVDNVRSGVMDKWRRRYEMAVEDLLKAGLVLVEDGGDEGAAEVVAPASDAEAPAAYSVDEEVKTPAWDEEPFEDFVEEVSAEEPVAPVQEEVVSATYDPDEEHPDILLEDEAAEEEAETPFTESAPDSLAEVPGADSRLELEQGESAPFNEPEPLDTIIPALHEDLALFPASESARESERAPEGQERLAELESRQEGTQEEEREEDVPKMGEDSLFVEEEQETVESEAETEPEANAEIEELEEQESASLPESAGPSVQEKEPVTSSTLAEQEESAPQPPVELTFDFEAPAATVETPAPSPKAEVEKPSFSTDEELSAIIASLSAEAAEAARKTRKVEEEKPVAAVAVVAPAREASVPAAPTPAPPLTGKAAEAEERFRVTHEAMLRGDVADAKILALGLAADMAQLEVERSETQVRNRQTRIEVDDHGITAAEEEVRSVEKALRDTEWHIGELQAEFLPKREHVNALRGQIAAIENGIADIEAQILELEARRDQEVRRKQDTNGELDAALTEESRIQTALDNLAEVERGTNEQRGAHSAELERRKVERATHQADLDAAVEELAARRNSMREIRRMVELLGGK